MRRLQPTRKHQRNRHQWETCKDDLRRADDDMFVSVQESRLFSGLLFDGSNVGITESNRFQLGKEDLIRRKSRHRPQKGKSLAICVVSKSKFQVDQSIYYTKYATRF